MVDEEKALGSSSPRGGAAHAMRAGAIVLSCGVLMLFFPLLVDLRSLNKYVVALGLVGLLIGLGCVTNGAIDALRAKGGDDGAA